MGEPCDADAQARRSRLVQGFTERVAECMLTYSFADAAFFADKLISLETTPKHVLLLAKAYFFNAEPARALHTLQKAGCVPGLVTQHECFGGKQIGPEVPECVLLAARCLESLQEWRKCLQMLSCFDPKLGANGSAFSAAATLSPATAGLSDCGLLPTSASMRGAVYTLAGQCCDRLGMRKSSDEHLAAAMLHYPYSYEAYKRCVDVHLPVDAARKTHDALRFPSGDVLSEVVKDLYACRLPIWVKEGEEPLVEAGSAATGGDSAGDADDDEYEAAGCLEGCPLEDELIMPEERRLTAYFGWNNCYVLRCRVERLFYGHFIYSAYMISRRVLERDSFDSASCALHTACLVALKKPTDLFQLGHEIANRAPNSVLSWFVVGSYYYAVGDYDKAGKYYYKATVADPSFLPAWIAYGHTFYALDEGEHTMNAYRSALRLFPGCHLAALYMGMQHAKSSNLHHAYSFLDRSVSLLGGNAEKDPAVCNELGVTHYKSGKYELAKTYFLSALARWNVGGPKPAEMMAADEMADEDAVLDTLLPSVADTMRDSFWEPATFNLGHTYRKLRRFNLALKCYNVSLTVKPHDPSVLSAIAFTHHLCGSLDEAVRGYHAALSGKSNDSFCRDMLARAIQESFQNSHVQAGAGGSLFTDSSSAVGGVSMAAQSILVGTTPSFGQIDASTVRQDYSEESTAGGVCSNSGKVV